MILICSDIDRYDVYHPGLDDSTQNSPIRGTYTCTTINTRAQRGSDWCIYKTRRINILIQIGNAARRSILPERGEDFVARPEMQLRNTRCESSAFRLKTILFRGHFQKHLSPSG